MSTQWETHKHPVPSNPSFKTHRRTVQSWEDNRGEAERETVKRIRQSKRERESKRGRSKRRKEGIRWNQEEREVCRRRTEIV